MTSLLSIPILTVDPAWMLPHQRSIKHRTKNATRMLQKKCYQIGKAIAKLLEGETCLKKEWEYSENPT